MQQITISGVTGTGPYEVQVCDITNTTCVIVTGSTNIPPSFTFNVPPPFENTNSVLIKIIDSTGCEAFQIYSCPPTPTPTPTPTLTPTPTPTYLCYCITAENITNQDGFFDYIDCSGSQISGVLVQSGITYYTCGVHPSNEINVITTVGDFCNQNQSCPTPSCTPTPTPPPCILGDYLVFVYEFPSGSGDDLDTITTLITPTTNGPLGYCPSGSLSSGVWGGPYLFWGGDNTSSNGSESVYIDVNLVKTNYPLSTNIEFTAEANWYSSVGTGVINIIMYVYSGGTMVSDGNFGFTNVGGSLVDTYTFPQSPLTLLNNNCTATQCLGTISYEILTGCISNTSICIDPTPTPTPSPIP